MNNYQMLNEIGGFKTRLTNLQTQSNTLKINFFDYIEGLDSRFNLLSNINREEFSFDVFGNKLKLKSIYDNSNASFQGKFSILIQLVSNNILLFEEFYFVNFDTLGNVKFSDEKRNIYSSADFSETFYIGVVNKLIASNIFEL